MDLHSKSSSSWIATAGQSHPNQAMLAGHRGMHHAGPPQQVRLVLLVLVLLPVHWKDERKVVYIHISRTSGCLAGLADSSEYWSLYSGLLSLKSKSPQISCWVLQLLARIPLTANLDI